MKPHPRLYLESQDLPVLRNRKHIRYRTMVDNLIDSAEWCLGEKPRETWIAPVSPDPVHSNLYDRFYAIMKDLAITEHLAFAHALTGSEQYGRAARKWVLASCRVWQMEAAGRIDGGKAYAVSRLLKGIAVGYDMIYGLLSNAERNEIRDTLARIGGKYFTDYFNTPEKTGPDFHTHHATVEWALLGIAALALLHEEDAAADWLRAAVRKFRTHLLPHGLAPDGAQVEGATFWASTMQYRLFFMDALKRVTGCDLFTPYRHYMHAEPALAGITGEHRSPLGACNASFALQPSYGQLDYCAPVLLALARRYRNPVYQRLALWDKTLGQIQKTRYVSPGGEQMLFELGGYACVWFDPEVPHQPDISELSWHFPSVHEVYARVSWNPGDLLTGIRGQQVIVHAGGRTVLKGNAFSDTAEVHTEPFVASESGDTAVLRCDYETDNLVVVLHRHGRCLVQRRSSEDWTWTCQGSPDFGPDWLSWENGVVLTVVQGTVKDWRPGAFREEIVVGNGLLVLEDPAPATESTLSIQPSNRGQIVVEVRIEKH